MLTRITTLWLQLRGTATSGCSQSTAQAARTEKTCTVAIEPIGHENQCPSGQIRFHFELSGCGGSKGTFDYVLYDQRREGYPGSVSKRSSMDATRNNNMGRDPAPFLACGEQFDEVDVVDTKKTCSCIGG